ncbi:hypothetical protein Btru_000313 [Bulinus truncatus]|nr:hypothetical protein Btru_000313 [Bulinus truncatus]
MVCPVENRKKSSSRVSSHNSSSRSSDSSVDLGDIQRRQTNRLRKELPAPQPRRLCFKTNIAGCTHTEVKRAIESQSGATVVWMQYDPIQFHHRRSEFSCVWIFELLNDADVEPLIFEGFSLRGAAMNVRRVDDVYREECAAYTMCSQVCMEHKKRQITQKSSSRKRYFND